MILLLEIPRHSEGGQNRGAPGQGEQALLHHRRGGRGLSLEKQDEKKEAYCSSSCDSISQRIADQLQELVGVEARNMVPGHVQRGGSPCAYDRVLSTQFGVHAAELIRDGVYGVTVALKGNRIVHNALRDIAGVPKPVPMEDPMVGTARAMGICMGD